MTALLLPAMLCIAAAPLSARDFSTESVGTASAEFLTTDVGARAVGMSRAYTAISNDAYSLYWNPAGLTQIPKASAAYQYTRYIGDINYNYAAYAQRINDMAVIGGAVRHMDVGSIPKTDIDGNQQGYFHPQAFVFDVGWGQYITDLSDSEKDISLGASFHYAHSDLIKHADIFAGDVGMQVNYYGAWLPWRLGTAIQNFGSGPRYDQRRERLPARMRIGAAVLPSKFWVVELDGTAGVNNQPDMTLGTEVTLDAGENAQAFLRAGVDSLPLSNGLDGFRGASFGVGIKTLQFSFDYAFTALGDLGDAHRFSVSWNFPMKGGTKRYRVR